MDKNIKLIAASVLSADFTKLGREIEDAETAGADWIHFDITDGHFVPNLTMGVNTVRAAKKSTSLPLDVHLMIANPDDHIGRFAAEGADYISFHAEASTHLNRTAQYITKENVKAGIALSPSTPLETIKWVIDYVDFVLLLSVNPGYGGQAYIPNVLDKARELRTMIEASGRDILIQADGGINLETTRVFSEAGINVFVMGSAFFDNEDYKKAVIELRKRM
jgi:ribulose-phosphate 3-epimerase